MAQFCIHYLNISLYLCFLAAEMLQDVFHCFSSLGCTVLTAQMHMYCHKPLTVADTHDSGFGHVLFHTAVSLLPVYNEKRKNVASPFNPITIKSTMSTLPARRVPPVSQQQAHQPPTQHSTRRFQTSGKLT